MHIQGLQSEQGLQLNGSLGKVVSCANPPRLGVKLYSKPASSSTQDRLRVIGDAASIKSFSASNLALHDNCCPLYLDLCIHIVELSLSTGTNMQACNEFLRDYNSRKPDDLPMAATLANIVREAGEFEFAVQLTSDVVSKLHTAPLQLRADEHRLRYDLGCSLSVLGRTAEAFAQANAINVERGGEALELRVELLDEIASSIKFQRQRPTGAHRPAPVMSPRHPENPNRSYTLELELQVRRERVRLQRSPAALLELAALLCRLGSMQQLQEGIDTYSAALQASHRLISSTAFVSHTPPSGLPLSSRPHPAGHHRERPGTGALHQRRQLGGWTSRAAAGWRWRHLLVHRL